MFYSIKGTVSHIDLNFVVIDCGGIGYKCNCSGSTISKITKTGEQAFLYTHMYIREDLLDLYGFFDMAELNCFKLLISTSGVGPRVAMAILSDLTPEKFALCVASSDAKTITKSQGVGPKLAQRIILELKDKISKQLGDLSATSNSDLFSDNIAPATSNASEALNALIVLGYSQSEVLPLISKLDPASSVEDMIKSVLKAMI